MNDHGSIGILHITRWNCGMFARDPGQYARERVDGDPQFDAKSWNYSANRKESTLLVLSRHESESIRVGEDIVITVVRIGPNAVRLGITAPRDMNIVRPESDDGRGKDERRDA